MLRMPDGMRDRIREAADASGRSMNSEIVARLESSFDDVIMLTPGLKRRIEKVAMKTGRSYMAEAIVALEDSFPEGMTAGALFEIWGTKILEAKSASERDKLVAEANSQEVVQSAGLRISMSVDPETEAPRLIVRGGEPAVTFVYENLDTTGKPERAD